MRNDNEKTMNDLEWLAFCYIADELEQPQRDEFELRLAEDQEARDAVVSAMETAQLLNAALESVALPDNGTTQVSERKSAYTISSLPSQKSLMAAAAAIVLAVSGLIWLANSPGLDARPDPIARQMNADPNADLAFAWAGSLELADELAEFPLDENGLTEVVFESDSLIEEVDDWMVLALADLEVDSEGESILPGEEQN